MPKPTIDAAALKGLRDAPDGALRHMFTAGQPRTAADWSFHLAVAAELDRRRRNRGRNSA